MLKLSESTIGMYERNERQPDYDTLNRIANYFKVTTDFLLGRTTSYPEPMPADIDEDPELSLWFKNIKDASPEKREELKRFWAFIMQNEKIEKMEINKIEGLLTTKHALCVYLFYNIFILSIYYLY